MHCFAVGSESVLVRLQFPLCGDKIRIATGTLKPLTLLYMGRTGQSTFFLTKSWSGLASSLHAEAAPKTSEWVTSKETGNPLLMGSLR